MPTITSIATTVPGFSATQAEVKAAFRPLFPLGGRRLDAAMALFDHAQIETRHSVLALPEIGQRRTLTETMRVYADSARELGQRVARDCLRRAGVAPTEVDLVVTVSCTGIMIPSLDAYLMNELGMRRDVRRLPITELGCVGGAAAVARAADHLRGWPGHRALVVSVELPSLSLQPLDTSQDSLVSSAIFGDGAAAVLIAGDGVTCARARDRDRDRDAEAVRILDTISHTIFASTHALGFDLHEDGFHPVLAKDVPALLRAEIGGVVGTLTERAGIRPDELSALVLHPGGRKVLNAVEEALGLTRETTQPSWDILREYGNQSSASVLFVLDRWLKDRRPTPGTLGLMAAFGPGLSAEVLLLQWT